MNGINWKRSARQNQDFELGKGAIAAKTSQHLFETAQIIYPIIWDFKC